MRVSKRFVGRKCSSGNVGTSRFSYKKFARSHSVTRNLIELQLGGPVLTRLIYYRLILYLL